jgi:lipopolysaccharide export system protein LptC
MTRTSFIRFLKIALPLLAVAILSTVFLVQNEDGFDGGLLFSTADKATLGDGLTIKNPRFSGKTDAGQAFSISAQIATPVGDDLRTVDVEGLSSVVHFEDGRQVEMQSATARIETSGQRISFVEGVNVRTSDGYMGHVGRLVADLESGVISGSEGVRFSGPTGKIDAQTMTISQSQNGGATYSGDSVLEFGGGVTLSLVPDT